MAGRKKSRIKEYVAPRLMGRFRRVIFMVSLLLVRNIEIYSKMLIYLSFACLKVALLTACFLLTFEKSFNQHYYIFI